MRLLRFATAENAQSEVIGTVLLVAIAVVLAAIVGVFALGQGERTDAAPQVAVDFEYDTETVTLTHEGGTTIRQGAALSTAVSEGTLTGDDWSDLDGPIDSGRAVTLTHEDATGPDPWSGETVSVTWTSADGETTAVIARSPAPS